MYVSGTVIFKTHRFVTLAVAFAVVAMFAVAGTAHAAGDVYVDDIRITEEAGNTSITFGLNNTQKNDLDGVRYGVRLQDKDGDLLFEHAHAGTHTLVRGESRKEISFTTPSGNGVYDVYLYLKNENGRTVTIAYAGKIELGGGSDALLTECKKISAETLDFECAVAGDAVGYGVDYDLHPGSMYAPVIQSGKILVSGQAVSVSLSADLPPGRYEIVFSLKNEQGEFVPAQQRVSFDVLGTWASVELRYKEAHNGFLFAQLWFDGAPRIDARAFRYWVIDERENVCANGELTLGDISPRVKEVNEELISTCEEPKLVGIVHRGKGDDGTYQILAALGSVDFEELARKSPLEVIKTGARFNDNVVAILIIIGAMFLIVGILIFARKMGIGPYVVAMVLAIGMGTVVHAAVFLRGSDQLTVSIATQFDYNEDVTYTLGLESLTTPGTKPSGASVEVSLDGGAYTEVVDEANAAIAYNESLGTLSAGTHTLTFRMPGDFFSDVFFGLGRFGVNAATFTPISFDVVQNTAPNTPVIAVGQCLFGEETGIVVYATDDDGDDLYYTVWLDGANEDRMPDSGTVPQGEVGQQGKTVIWTYGASHSVRARVTDTSGLYTENTAFVNCSTPCSHCSYDDGSGASIIITNPSIIFGDSTTNVSWEDLENVTSCTVTGVDALGTTIDSWGWEDVVSVYDNRESSPISSKTTYTIQCQDLFGDPVNDSTTVNVQPQWRER